MPRHKNTKPETIDEVFKDMLSDNEEKPAAPFVIYAHFEAITEKVWSDKDKFDNSDSPDYPVIIQQTLLILIKQISNLKV